jgi:hypothetical protein
MRKKAKKPLVGTWYGVQDVASEEWLAVAAYGELAWRKHFPEADLWTTRSHAKLESTNTSRKCRIVPVRGRPLSSKTKAAKKRTR